MVTVIPGEAVNETETHTLPWVHSVSCRKSFTKQSILNIPEMCHKVEGNSPHTTEFYFIFKGGDVWELAPI